MHRLPSQLLTKRVALAAAWVVLLVLGMGLSRSLVVCTKACCGGHVQIGATASCAPEAPAAHCACCEKAAHGKRPASDGRGGALQPHCSGCDYVSLGIDLGLPPTTVPMPAPAALPPAEPLDLALPRDGERLAAAHPPATGPPRCDHRTALLATTILRL